MSNILGSTVVSFPVTFVEWAPKNWSDRKAWGPQASDGFYMTKAGELYRLCGKLVIYVSQEEYPQ